MSPRIIKVGQPGTYHARSGSKEFLRMKAECFRKAKAERKPNSSIILNITTNSSP
jgi:hypothetical protein